MKQGFSFKPYLHDVAQKLRQHESERARGNLSLLEHVEHTSDETLLRKWGWISTIVGAIFSFLVMPFAISILQPFVPELFDKILWAVAKVSMGMSLLMFAASIYFTIGLDSDNK